jgi:type IV pilus assembly protein PilM
MAGIAQKLSSMFSRSKHMIGLDIGYDSIKAVELHREGEVYKLQPFGTIPIQSSSDDEGRRAATLQALREMKKTFGFTTNKVATAVSGENVIVRILRLPIFDASDESLEFAVRGDARDFIPFDMEDVVFDYQKLGEVDHEDNRVVEVLIVAVRKDVIKERLKLLEDAKLEPVVVDVGSFALCNALSEGGGIEASEAVALVDIGAEITSVAILKDGVTRFTRDLTIGGGNITEVIANELELAVEEAEKLKCQFGILMEAAPTPESQPELTISHGFDTPADDGLYSTDTDTSGSLFEDTNSDGLESLYADTAAGSELDSLYEAYGGDSPEESAEGGDEKNGDILSELSQTIDKLTPQVDEKALEYGAEGQKVSEICEHFIGEITGEVKRSLLYYENQLGGEVISRIILSGGTSKMCNIEQFFESSLDIKCQKMETLPKIGFETDGEDIEDLYPLYGVGIGLSLRSFFDKE